MLNAIIYTSNTGYTRQYALLLGEHTGLPVYSSKEAVSLVRRGSGVIYLGWLMAGKIQGYAKAARRYNIAAACGVGMGASGSQLRDVRRANRLPEDLPVFTLQGGFDIKRLHGIYRFMMTVMVHTAGKGLADKKDRTEEEDTMLDMLLHGGSRVSEENLKEILDWYRGLP